MPKSLCTDVGTAATSGNRVLDSKEQNVEYRSSKIDTLEWFTKRASISRRTAMELHENTLHSRHSLSFSFREEIGKSR